MLSHQRIPRPKVIQRTVNGSVSIQPKKMGQWPRLACDPMQEVRAQNPCIIAAVTQPDKRFVAVIELPPYCVLRAFDEFLALGRLKTDSANWRKPAGKP